MAKVTAVLADGFAALQRLHALELKAAECVEKGDGWGVRAGFRGP